MPLPPIIVDDDPGTLAGVPGAAGASTATFTAAGPRVFQIDDYDDGTWAWPGASAPLFADFVALTAVYDNVNAVVHLTATGLDPFTLVRFERSTNLVQWTTVRGGVAVGVSNGQATLDDYEFAAGVVNYYRVVTVAPFGQTSDPVSITPALDRIWLKSTTRPFLNRAVTVVAFTDPGRPARSSEFDVVSRTLPIGINDLRGSRRWTVDLYVATAADAQTLDYILAAGDVMFLHTPAGCDVPGGYVAIKDTSQRHPDGKVHGKSRVFTLPLVEVAAPGPDVVAAIGTWASVLAAYPTWQSVLDAFPTWADLLAFHGSPSEVIVP